MKFPYLRVAEDLVVAGGTAVATWQATRSPGDVLSAVAAAPAARSAVALLLTKGHSSGLVEALSLVRRAVAALAAAEASTPTQAPAAAPTPTQTPIAR